MAAEADRPTTATSDAVLTPVPGRTASGGRLVAVVCAAQVLVQIGAFFWPALLPAMMPLWGLTNSEAGWITAIFYAAYMVAVPVLVTLTDRVDAKRVYLFGVGCTIAGHLLFGCLADGFWSALATRALTGIGWAGTYMTGLKLLADQVDAKLMSRAVTGHAASIGISGALSFSCADLLAELRLACRFRRRRAERAASRGSLVALSVPRRDAPPPPPGDGTGAVRFPAGAAQSLGHGLCAGLLRPHAGDERAARLGRGLSRLRRGRAPAPGETLLSPTLVVTALGLIGTAASVLGNEAAIRFGPAQADRARDAGVDRGRRQHRLRRHARPIRSPSALLLLYGFIVWLDSSSLTAGAAGTAEPVAPRRDAGGAFDARLRGRLRRTADDRL